MKLFLYSSYLIAAEHSAALNRLVGKDPAGITIAAIANATDIIPDSESWVTESRDALKRDGARVEAVDLRDWLGDRAGLRAKLASKDVIWLCGGHTYYLRWILRESGADEMIRELVRQGTVYAGWSAGAEMAGPTLRYFDLLDDTRESPEVIWEGLGLTDVVVVPHVDLDEFAEDMKEINHRLMEDGFTTVPLTEAKALLIDGETQQVLEVVESAGSERTDVRSGAMAEREPTAELQPQFSSDDATATPWAEACGRLEKAEIFWLTTVRPDGRPHVTPLLAVWLDGALYFCTDAGERKAKNLVQNAHCVLTTGRNVLDGGLDLVVEGEAAEVGDEAELRSVADTYESKYGPHFTAPDGTFFGLGDTIRRGDALVYRVAPSTAFGFGKGTFSQTRWRFSREIGIRQSPRSPVSGCRAVSGRP